MLSARRPPTSVDVARLAGVSRTTVSFVLNGTPNQRISQETRERVLAAAQMLDYQLQPSARALRKGQNDDIYLILDRPLTLFISSLASVLQQRARKLGYNLAIYFNDTTSEEARRQYLVRLFSQRPRGIVCMPGSITQQDIELARSKGAGSCVFANDWPTSNGLSSGVEIGHLIARHLIERGHHNIGVIVPQNRALQRTIIPRVAGMRSELETIGVDDLRELPIEEITLDEARRIACHLSTDPTRPTALYGFNDEYCFHLLRAFREYDLRVPEDIALVGSDDTFFCELTTPSLTSIRLDMAGIGRYLIDFIDQQANSEESRTQHMQLERVNPAVLIHRESS